MKGYRVFTQDQYSFESEPEYTLNYKTALQMFNNLLRKTMKEYEPETITKDDFGDVIDNFKKYHAPKGIELICRRCPFILYKSNNKLIATIYYWYRCSYEYREYDISSIEVVLEEIEFKE